MSHFTGLVCDKPGCHNTYQKPGGGESWWTRIAAT